jgi:hypothetical protein
MELIISGAVVLLVGSFAAWKLLRRSQPGKMRSATPASPVAAQPSMARQQPPTTARPQASVTPPAQAPAQQPHKAQAAAQTTAKAQVAEKSAVTPGPAPVEALELPHANKAVAAAKPAQGQKAVAPVAATSHSAKDDAEDWLLPSLSTKGSDDADTELVLEDD